MKSTYFIAIAISIFFCSCKKESDSSNPNNTNTLLPTVTTTAITQITSTTAQSGGTISSDGGSPILARGVCWAPFDVPTTAFPKTTDGTGTGAFSSSITGLTPNMNYTVRAYATNAYGTAYGQEVHFFAPQQTNVPTVNIVYLNSMTSTLVTLQGQVADSGHLPITTRGFCWSTSPNPTINDNIDPQGSTGLYTFQSLLTSFTVLTTYHFRAYATNSAGTGYSNDTSLTVVYHIGEGHGGGRIFYIDGTGLHGLVAATSDQTLNAKWNNTTNPYANINAYSYSNGVANTNAIIAAVPNPNHAAAICRLYNGGGYSDWYLPSVNELVTLQQQAAVFGNFQPGYYWSSTASSTYNANAWAVSGGGVASEIQDKTYFYPVRAIRAF